MTQISSPNNSLLVLGRVRVLSDSNVATAHDFSKQMQLTPLSSWAASQMKRMFAAIPINRRKE